MLEINRRSLIVVHHVVVVITLCVAVIISYQTVVRFLRNRQSVIYGTLKIRRLIERLCYMQFNLQKLTSLNLLLSTTVMTPVKPQISAFKSDKSCQVGFNALQRLYS
jgi:hypothetical protein